MDAKKALKFPAYIDHNLLGQHLKLTGSKKYRRLWWQEREKNRHRKLITFDNFLKKSKRAYMVQQRKAKKAEESKKGDVVDQEKAKKTAKRERRVAEEKACILSLNVAEERNERMASILDFFADDMVDPLSDEDDLQQESSMVPVDHCEVAIHMDDTAEYGDTEPGINAMDEYAMEICKYMTRHTRVPYDARPRPTGNVSTNRPRTVHYANTSQYDGTFITATPSDFTMVTGCLSRSHSLDTIYLEDVTLPADDNTPHLIGQRVEWEVESSIASWRSSNSLKIKEEVESIMTSWRSSNSLQIKEEGESIMTWRSSSSFKTEKVDLMMTSSSSTTIINKEPVQNKQKMSRVKRFFVKLFGSCVGKQNT